MYINNITESVNMSAPDLIDSIFSAASESANLSPSELMARAGLYSSGISRIRATGDCRYSTIERLLDAAGLKLIVVKNDRDSEMLAKGALF